MEWVWVASLVVLLLLGWLLTVIGLPGNWLMVAATTVYSIWSPTDPPLAIGWQVPAALLVMAALGELIEFVAGALGAAKAGSSRRSAGLALVGAMVGGTLGLCVSLPVPLVGPLIGAFLFAALGASIGAVVGEAWNGGQQNWQRRWEIGKAAFLGRMLGTLAKMLVGSLMVIVVLLALVI